MTTFSFLRIAAPLGRESRSIALLGLGALFVCLLASPCAHAAPPEVRGVWLTTTGPNHIVSGANTASVMTDLRAVGMNTVYVETWKNGYTNFPSATLSSFLGTSVDRAPYLGTTRDLVQETLIHAHRNQMNYVGWFEYGLMAEFIGSGGNTATPLGVKMRNNGWLLRDQAGQLGNASNGFAWMNPAVPEVRQFVIDLTLEAVNRYDFDGIQFDDHMAWPQSFGWDTTTAGIYLAETGRALPTSIDDAPFRTWRQGKVTQFATELVTAVRAARPDIQIGVSPSITNFSDVVYNAVWPQWQNTGLFDEYAVQVYRDNYASFNSTLTGQTNQFTPAERASEFVVGLRGNGSGANTPIADLTLMIERSRAVGAAGHAIFYSKAVRDDYRTQLTAFYDVAGQGHAPSTQHPIDNRPAPLVAAANGTNNWSVTVPSAGNYRVVAQVGTLWREVSAGAYAAGLTNISVTGASRVELLVDRRPEELPDFNGDGRVDAADFTIWADTFASITDLRADANGDRFVNGLDYDIWVANYGRVVGGPSAAIPEPAAVLLMLPALASPCRRRG
ncbi:MAG: family 10 glycosylhydrolase [Lacipirellulaceae bacterium]